MIAEIGIYFIKKSCRTGLLIAPANHPAVAGSVLVAYVLSRGIAEHRTQL